MFETVAILGTERKNGDREVLVRNTIFSTTDEISAEKTKTKRGTLEDFLMFSPQRVPKFQLKFRNSGQRVALFRLYHRRRQK